MDTRIDEIEDRVYRISNFMPEISERAGFIFNQLLLDADEPLLFHTGMRHLSPLVSEAITTVMPLSRLRWMAFGHIEADECGAMNEFRAAAPHTQVTAGIAAGEHPVRCTRPCHTCLHEHRATRVSRVPGRVQRPDPAGLRAGAAPVRSLVPAASTAAAPRHLAP